MPQVQLTLGDITFANLEVPESLNWGGDQSTVIQKLIGGSRVIDAMGRDDDAIQWTGWFLGASAVDRAQYVNTQRILGQPLSLTMGPLNFTVVIRSFKASYEFQFRIRYSITCEVMQDNTTPTVLGSVPGIDDQMNADMNTATGLGSLIGDSTLTGLLGTVNTAISGISTFANAAQSTISSVLQPIAAVQSRVKTLLASAINTTTNITTLGGVLPYSPVAQAAATLSGQVAAFESQPSLLSLQGVMGRMAANLNSVRSNATKVTTAGGNLQTIAAKQYGDATSWTGIAKANGLTDPVVSGVQTLTVPVQPDKAGGILGG